MSRYQKNQFCLVVKQPLTLFQAVDVFGKRPDHIPFFLPYGAPCAYVVQVFQFPYQPPRLLIMN